MGRKKMRDPDEQPTGRPRSPRPKGLLGDLAIRIEGLRDAKAMSQHDLANKSGVGLGTIARLERGEGVPRIDTLISVAAALGMKARELMQPCEGW